MDFSARIIRGVEEHRGDLDRIIEKYSSHWKIDDIGKKFGSEDSGAFINGVLDKVKSEESRQAE